MSTLRGLIVPGLFQAFAAFLFRQYFLNFPRELEEGARIDGLNYWGTFWRIVVPNSRGFFAAIATITGPSPRKVDTRFDCYAAGRSVAAVVVFS